MTQRDVYKPHTRGCVVRSAPVFFCFFSRHTAPGAEPKNPDDFSPAHTRNRQLTVIFTDFYHLESLTAPLTSRKHWNNVLHRIRTGDISALGFIHGQYDQEESLQRTKKLLCCTFGLVFITFSQTWKM